MFLQDLNVGYNCDILLWYTYRILIGLHSPALQEAAEPVFLVWYGRPRRLPLPADRCHPRLRAEKQHRDRLQQGEQLKTAFRKTTGT